MSFCTIRRSALFASALVCFGHGALAENRTAAPSPVIAARPTPDTVRGDAARKRRAVKAEANAKVLAALQTDPRFAGIQKDFADAAKISDEAVQKQKLRAIATRAQPVRNEAIRKAGVDVTALSSQVSAARRFAPPALPKPFHPPALPTTPGAPAAPPPPAPVTVTAFTEVDTRKIDCPDSGDIWSFPGKSSHYDISSAPFDHDCGWIRAAKGAFINVPAGVKHVALTIKLDFDLKVIVSSIGIWAQAESEVGVRVANMNGTPIDVIKVGNLPPVPTSVSFCWVKPVSTYQGPDFVPYSDSGDQGQNTTVSCAFDVDPRGGPMMVAPYVGGSVDADLTAYAKSKGTVSPHSVTAVFSQ
jgi:hypothetical protein